MKAAFYPAALVALLVVGGRGSKQDPQLGATPVAISGRLESREIPGPPGFGETPKIDSRATIYYPVLPKPLSAAQLHLPVEGLNQSDKTYARIQLWCGDHFSKCKDFLRSHIGQNILVSGVTAYALEANDVFSVTMTVGGA